MNALSSNETLEVKYSHGSKTEKTKIMAGEITGLSVAVGLISDVSDKDISKVKSIVSAAVGADIERGDVITIEAFTPRKPLEAASSSNINSIHKKAIPKSEYSESDKESASQFNYMITLAITIFFILLLIVNYKRKSLPLKEKEKALIEVNEWLSKDNSYAK